jgi:hypothetical protein
MENFTFFCSFWLHGHEVVIMLNGESPVEMYHKTTGDLVTFHYNIAGIFALIKEPWFVRQFREIYQ